MSEEVENCPACGALPCDWTNDPREAADALRQAEERAAALETGPTIFVGWAALAPNGNVRMWSRDKAKVDALASAHSLEVVRIVRAPLLGDPPGATEALKTALAHIEHMSAWIAAQKGGYSFESLGEDMGDMRAALAAAHASAEAKSSGRPCRNDGSGWDGQSVASADSAIQLAADRILDIGDRIADEGDRAYLGSTNDVEIIRQVGRELQALAEARSGDPDDYDVSHTVPAEATARGTARVRVVEREPLAYGAEPAEVQADQPEGGR